jgi:hypothetical protein
LDPTFQGLKPVNNSDFQKVVLKKEGNFAVVPFDPKLKKEKKTVGIVGSLLESKMKGEVTQAEEKMPKKPVAKSMMEALRETAESLK